MEAILMDEDGFHIVCMPPKRKYPIELQVKSIRKAKPTPKCFEIDKEHFQKTLEEGVWANNPFELLDKLIQPVVEK